MGTETSNIDELLMGQKTHTQPATPENSLVEVDDIDPEIAEEAPANEPSQDPSNDESEPESELPEAAALETDEYGNENPSKLYNEDEVNERINRAIRERFDRFDRNNSATQQQMAQHVQQNFTSDPNSPDTWQQQLESFVKQTLVKMNQEQNLQVQKYREQQAQAEFSEKLQSAKHKFPDFENIVLKQPITDAMASAAREMKDPAAFLYAASKRASAELKQISEMESPYAQAMAIGKLEEKLKKQKSITNTPKPISRSKEDLNIPHSKSKQPTIEELIAKDAAKRRALQNSHRRK